jgi:hypothetical protein
MNQKLSMTKASDDLPPPRDRWTFRGTARRVLLEIIHEFDTPARVTILFTAGGAAVGQRSFGNALGGLAIGFVLSLAVNALAIRWLAAGRSLRELKPPDDSNAAFAFIEERLVPEKRRVALVLTVSAALTLWVVAPYAQLSALVLATGIALHFPALILHRASMRTTLTFILWATGILTLCGAAAFRALAFLPAVDFPVARESFAAVALSLLNLVTLGLYPTLPAEGWPRVVALAQMAFIAVALGVWWLTTTIWRTGDWKPNPNSYHNDPVYQVIDVALVVAFAIVILKASPGNVGAGWFIWTLLIAIARYPMYVVLIAAPWIASMKWRIQIFIRYVFTQLLWFALAFFAGSNSAVLTFAVESPTGPHVAPLTAIQSVYLALGSLVGVGAAGLTPLDDLTRLVVMVELLMPATFVLWLFGAAAWLPAAATARTAAPTDRTEGS